VLVRDGGTVDWLDGARSVPLASTTVRDRPEAVVPLGPGDTVLAYTDGLVERRGVRLDDRLDELAREISAAAHLDTMALVDQLIDRLAPAGTREDDVAVVAYRAPPPA
ncbi:MAG TPA: SpoIIE family protein phosphatase, partial [Acidimicrobiales bacterium]|nr:SpoIIE family protein phosphatase [Acidimicrobiales bacterium]